jgi:hypothetical protein
MAVHPVRTSSLRYEVIAGRALAACVHPEAAWRSQVRSFRMFAIAGYFAAGYVLVLSALALID